MEKWDFKDYEISNLFNTYGLEAYSSKFEDGSTRLFIFLTENSLDEFVVIVPPDCKTPEQILQFTKDNHPELFL